MSLEQCSIPIPDGWVHCVVHVGLNASYLGINRVLLKRKPTIQQLRSEDYQGVTSAMGMDLREFCRDIKAQYRCPLSDSCEKHLMLGYPETPVGCLDVLLGKEEEVIVFSDYSTEDYRPYFHYPNISEMEARWHSIGREEGYIHSIEEQSITAGLDICGRVDSLVIIPDDKMTLYQVTLNGIPIFTQHIESPRPRTRLPFALLVFEEGQLNYTELSTFGRGEPEWLRTFCSSEVEFV